MTTVPSQRRFLCLLVCLLTTVGLRAQATVEASGPGASSTVVPRLIKFSGVLNLPAQTARNTDDQSRGQSPTAITATFALYELPEGGNPLWSELQKVQVDEQGRYTVLLGATQADGLPLDLFTSGKALWLGVQPQAPGAVEQPRVLLVAVPYALKASDSDTLGGLPASAFALAAPGTHAAGVASALAATVPGTTPSPGSRVPSPEAQPQPATACAAVTSDGTASANYVAKFTTACNVEKSLLFDNGTNVGVGTITPGAFLDTQGATTATSGNVYGSRTITTWNPAASTAANVFSLFANAATASGNSQNYTGNLTAFQFESDHNGTGTLAKAYGGYGAIRNLSTGTINTAYSLYSYLNNYSTGTVNNAYGLFVAAPTNAGGGTVTNYYGVYISNPTTAATGYGLYSLAATNYISGKLGINTTSPSASLEVNGTTKFDNTVTFPATQVFTGNGSGLTTLNASSLSSGTVPSAVLSGMYSGTVTFSNASNVFTGSGLGLTKLNPANLSAGTAGISITGNAATATNATELGGLAASAFAQLGAASNTFTGSITAGNLSVGAGDINLPQTSGAAAGVINLGGYQFAHNCCPGYPGNTFLGLNAGNFSVDGSDPNTGLSGNTGVGFWALNSLTRGWANTAVGFYALLSNTTGQTSTAVGYQALQMNTTGGPNTAIGFRALQDNTSGDGNTATGYFTLSANTTGVFNTAYGETALFQNTTGEFNTAVGKDALEINTTGYWDTATGNAALNGNTTGYLNTADGVEALYANTTGLYNTADGGFALSNNTTGTGNIALGYEAGITSDFSNSTGSYNMYLGTYATPGGANQDTISYATAIGANSTVTVSNAIVLGPTTDVDGNPLQIDVGIGTVAPAYILDVNGSGPVRLNDTGTGDILVGQNNGANKFRVDQNGLGYFDGGTQTGGADFAESVAVEGTRSQVEPGDVLEIDPGADRHLALSRHAYSTLVAGIYSTKPGVLATPHAMDDPAIRSSEVPLAVVGIVPCKVTAENGPIARGDLLVTSSTAGYAMKGTDRNRMLGAVVGKALQALPAGMGVIQVLVTLQ